MFITRAVVSSEFTVAPLEFTVRLAVDLLCFELPADRVDCSSEVIQTLGGLIMALWTIPCSFRPTSSTCDFCFLRVLTLRLAVVMVSQLLREKVLLLSIWSAAKTWLAFSASPWGMKRGVKRDPSRPGRPVRVRSHSSESSRDGSSNETVYVLRRAL